MISNAPNRKANPRQWARGIHFLNNWSKDMEIIKFAITIWIGCILFAFTMAMFV
jgi:hypothetical protein